jgi:hypothetical protein
VRNYFAIVAVGLAMSIAATPAQAQRRARAPRAAAGPVPDTGMGAVGVSFGAALPNDASLETGPILAGTLETYLSPRVSVRAQIGRAWWDVIPRPDSKVKPLFVDGNIVYNWEGGKVHPYVTGGLGWYHYDFEGPPVDGASTNEFGGDLGGGAEYFYTRHTTLTFELLFHVVNTPTVTPGIAFNSRFRNFSVGVKHYF